jgi:hypothetical protein
VGTVNKIGDDHIGLLVYGVFNAVIGADHIRGDFKCRMQVGARWGGAAAACCGAGRSDGGALLHSAPTCCCPARCPGVGVR